MRQHTSIVSDNKRYNISIIADSDKIASVMPIEPNSELLTLSLRGIKLTWRKDLKNGAIYSNDGRFLGYISRSDYRNLYFFSSVVLKDAKKRKRNISDILPYSSSNSINKELN